MKKLLTILGILLLAPALSAQTTTVSATVVDTDGTTWANGSWSVAFRPNPSQPNPAIYNIGGTPLSLSVLNQAGFLDGSGVFSFSVYQTAPITPIGSSWTLTICPNAITACGVYTFAAVGSTQSLSSALTPVIPAPHFRPVAGAFGYTDAEAVIQLIPGSTYWNVTSNSQRCNAASGWGACNSTGSSAVTAIIPGTNTTCATLSGGKCIGDVTVNAPLAAINQLTSDVLAGPGTGSVAATLATVGSAGSCGDASNSCSLTFDTKGRETARSNVAITAAGITQLTSDVIAGPGTGSQAATLAAVGSAGSCGDSTHSCGLTFDAKGRETARANVAIAAGTFIAYACGVTSGDPVTCTPVVDSAPIIVSGVAVSVNGSTTINGLPFTTLRSCTVTPASTLSPPGTVKLTVNSQTSITIDLGSGITNYSAYWICIGK